MAKWKVRLVYKDIVEVDVEADSKEEARDKAIESADQEGHHHDYYLEDSTEQRLRD